MTTLSQRFYFAGYSQLQLPRSLRRVFAQTAIHRAWLAGHMGVFQEEQDGCVTQCGVSTRNNMHYRKGVGAPASSVHKIVSHILVPFGRIKEQNLDWKAPKVAGM